MYQQDMCSACAARVTPANSSWPDGSKQSHACLHQLLRTEAWSLLR